MGCKAGLICINRAQAWYPMLWKAGLHKNIQMLESKLAQNSQINEE
jgi:hypothetical protein